MLLSAVKKGNLRNLSKGKTPRLLVGIEVKKEEKKKEPRKLDVPEPHPAPSPAPPRGGLG